MTVAVAEVQGYFGNPEEKELPLLEAATNGLVKTRRTEKTKCLP
jgi:hypothetical protein